MSTQSEPSPSSSSTNLPDESAPSQKSQTFIILASLIAGVFGAAWILLHSPYVVNGLVASPSQADLASKMVPYNKGEQGGGQGDHRGRRDRLDYTFKKQSLFVANLTSIVGDYVVSVRRVQNYRYPFDSNPIGGTSSVPSEPFIMSLQVMSRREGGMKQIESLSEGFSISDIRGKRYLPTELLSETDFPEGRGCVFQLPAIASDVDYLPSVNGMLRLTPSARTAPSRTLPFHIANVPLPWKQRVFGVIGSALLDADVARDLHLPASASENDRLEWVTGAQMEAVLARLPQEAFQSPDLPLQFNRVVLTQNVPNVVRLPLVSIANPRMPPASFLSCAVSPRLLTDGEIAIHLLLKGEGRKTVQIDHSVWSNTPQILIVPVGRLLSGPPASTVLVLYLHLYLDNTLPDNSVFYPLPRSFRAKPGERGGALAGRVSTSAGPLGAGSARLAVSRLTSTGQVANKTETITATLDEQGNFVLANLSSGRYRMTLLQTLPAISPVAIHTTFERYLARRCGILHPIVDQPTQEIFVRPGDRTELPPWIYKEQK